MNDGKFFYAGINNSWQHLLEQEEALWFPVEETLVGQASAVQLDGSLALVREGQAYTQALIVKVPDLHIQGVAVPV